MKKHPKKISEEIMHENPWWTYKHDTLEKPQGGMGDYYYGETSGMAMVIPVMPDGRLVLVLQHRYLEDKQSIEFPAGGIPNAMEPIAAAQKELLEETGCIADDYVKLGVIQSSNGLLKDKTFMLTGKLKGISRAEAKSLIEENSGTSASSVSKKLNYLIIGAKPTKKKVDMAKELKISLLNQSQFLKMLNKTS